MLAESASRRASSMSKPTRQQHQQADAPAESLSRRANSSRLTIYFNRKRAQSLPFCKINMLHLGLEINHLKDDQWMWESHVLIIQQADKDDRCDVLLYLYVIVLAVRPTVKCPMTGDPCVFIDHGKFSSYEAYQGGFVIMVQDLDVTPRTQGSGQEPQVASLNDLVLDDPLWSPACFELSWPMKKESPFLDGPRKLKDWEIHFCGASDISSLVS
nr:glucan synthase-like 8 [Tanacetum cinerariifolium]